MFFKVMIDKVHIELEIIANQWQIPYNFYKFRQNFFSILTFFAQCFFGNTWKYLSVKKFLSANLLHSIDKADAITDSRQFNQMGLFHMWFIHGSTPGITVNKPNP